MVKHLPNQSLERERRKDKGEPGVGEEDDEEREERRTANSRSLPVVCRPPQTPVSSVSKLSPHFLGASHTGLSVSLLD